MINKKGFTLIEILGILILLSIIGIIAFLSIDKILKSSKDKAYEKQLKMIELSAKNYMSDHINLLPSNLENYKSIKLLDLKIGGYAEINIADPKTGKCFDNNLTINVSKISDDYYKYEIDPDTIKFVDCNLLIDSIKTDPVVSISGEPDTFITYITGSEMTLTVTYNKSNNSLTNEQLKQKVNFIIDGGITSSEFNLSNEIEINSGYERMITVKNDFAGYGKNGVLNLKILEGFIVNDVGIKSDEVISKEIFLVGLTESNVGVSKYTSCNNVCTVWGTCDKDIIKTDKGIKCKIDFGYVYQRDFHVLGDDGESLFLLLDEDDALLDFPNNEFYGYTLPYGENNVDNLLDKMEQKNIETFYSRLPKFDYNLYEKVGDDYYPIGYKEQEVKNASMRLPRYDDFYNLGGTDIYSEGVPLWARASDGNSYLLSSLGRSFAGEQISTNGEDGCAGNCYTVEYPLCIKDYFYECHRGKIRPVVKIPKINVIVNNNL